MVIGLWRYSILHSLQGFRVLPPYAYRTLREYGNVVGTCKCIVLYIAVPIYFRWEGRIAPIFGRASARRVHQVERRRVWLAIPEFIVAWAYGAGALCMFVVTHRGQALWLRPFANGTLSLSLSLWIW
jgi:hypothetical protein